jgi:hypothetical protein
MRIASWKAAALAALVPLSASSACHATDSLFLEAVSTCVQNHADPEAVLAAARAKGWHGIPSGEAFGLVANPNILLKGTGGEQWMLKVKASSQSGRVIRSCSIFGEDVSWADTLQAARNSFNAPPSQETSQVVEWVYAERDGQRLFFRGGQLKHLEELTGGGTLHVLGVVHVPAQDPAVMVLYREVPNSDAR